MTNIQRFYTNVERAIKNGCVASGGTYGLQEACADAARLFEHDCAANIPASLAAAAADYWKKTYIDTAQSAELSTLREKIGILGGLLAFFEGSEEDAAALSDADWQELAEMVNCNADEMPIEILQSLMATLVSKNALR